MAAKIFVQSKYMNDSKIFLIWITVACFTYHLVSGEWTSYVGILAEVRRHRLAKNQ